MPLIPSLQKRVFPSVLLTPSLPGSWETQLSAVQPSQSQAREATESKAVGIYLPDVQSQGDPL